MTLPVEMTTVFIPALINLHSVINDVIFLFHYVHRGAPFMVAINYNLDD